MRTRRNPEYQKLLQTGIRIKEICRKIPGAGMIQVYQRGIVDFYPIQTYDNLVKSKPMYDAHVLEFVVTINDVAMVSSMKRYLNYHYAMEKTLDGEMAEREFQMKRDITGQVFMKTLFGSSYEESLSLIRYNIMNIIFDCIDYKDDDCRDYIFHFMFKEAYMEKDAFGSDAKRMLDLLAEDINNA